MILFLEGLFGPDEFHRVVKLRGHVSDSVGCCQPSGQLTYAFIGGVFLPHLGRNLKLEAFYL